MTTNTTIPLYQVRRDGIPPGVILAELKRAGLADGLAFALLMGRRRFDLARVGTAGLYVATGNPARLEDAYEIRLFGPRTDAHWQRTGADTGRMSVLTIQALSGEDKGSTIETTGSLCRHYRLFGKTKTEAMDAKGWCRLSSSRVAPIPVPVEAEANKYLQLDAVEHIARFKHGNAAVIAERLTGISVVSATEHQKEHDDGQ
ncbi:type III-D CRISPR-associated protein Csx19 [Blastochloris sulfoviridis]|uniref:Uncharacterized protein n=1 Tax=Blastochloris sulfoviridis TaxID=50712 RepID=A0A5M6HQS0_9HYPH|nr:CRISPR-associated protein Csx19 [Blastochloris sulfoviridis]KAA5598213.1 hypothetical protein F1193_13580 [Blastochloris sulfoviridis]